MTLGERESQRQALQRRFDQAQASDPASRNRLGQFATPIALATSIARELQRLRLDSPRRHHPARFLDPAVGLGAFYSAALQVFPDGAIASAVGIEIDPAIAEQTQKLWEPCGLSVVHGDFTAIEPPERPESRFDLMLVNPPYVRHHHLAPGEKTRLKAEIRDRLGIMASGLSGLYAWFLLWADAWLESGGLAAWLVPSEFMDVNYGDALRRYLCERVTLRRVHRFDATDAQFADALVTSALLFFEKTAPAPSHRVEFSVGGSLESPLTTREVAVDELRASRKWPPSERFDSDSFANLKSDRIRLGDVFDVRRGIATGANEFFILEREQAERLGIPDECLRPILPGPRFVHDPIIESDARGYPLLPRMLAVLDCPWSETEIRERHPRLWSYLEQGRSQGIDRRYLASRRSPWHSQEQREPAPLLCSYMGRGSNDRPPFRFLLNRSRAIASNVWLMLYPKGEIAREWGVDPTVAEHWLAQLQTIRPEQWIKQGRVYGGGLRKLEPSELMSFVFPESISGITTTRTGAGS